jgi:hypothetical protein
MIQNAFEHFTTREFLFECTKAQNTIPKMTPEDQKEFDFDLITLRWDQFMYNFCYGIITHLLKREEIFEGFEPRNFLLEYRKNIPYRDLSWAKERYQGQSKQIEKSELAKKILDSYRV